MADSLSLSLNNKSFTLGVNSDGAWGELVGSSSGSLKWNDSDILTSANTGGGFLPLSGGTLIGNLTAGGGLNVNGNMTTNGNIVIRRDPYGYVNTTPDSMLIFGTEGDGAKGAMLWCVGGEFIDQYNEPGIFRLRAAMNGTFSDLIGNPAGRLTWQNREVVTSRGFIGIPGYIIFNFSNNDPNTSYAFIWGEFLNANENGVVITLPISIHTIVTAWINPTVSSSNTGIFIVQLNSTQIRITTGKGDSGRGGQYGLIAHVSI